VDLGKFHNLTNSQFMKIRTESYAASQEVAEHKCKVEDGSRALDDLSQWPR
jgi:hypothetical protein